MNKIFKVIWNPATGSYTVASETAKSRGKKSGRSKLLISATVAGECCRRLGYRLRQEGTTVRASIMARNRNRLVAIGEDAKANSFTDTGVAPAPQ